MHYKHKLTSQIWLIQTGQMCFPQFLFPLIILTDAAQELTDLLEQLSSQPVRLIFQSPLLLFSLSLNFWKLLINP